MYQAAIIILVIIAAGYVLYRLSQKEGMTKGYSPFVTTLNRHVEKSGPDGDVVTRCGVPRQPDPYAAMDENIKPEHYLFNQIRGDNE
jgi:hypothetical protein